MSLGRPWSTLTILVGATTAAVLTLWRRHRRWQLQQRLLASAEAPIDTDTPSTAAGTATATAGTATATAGTAEANTRPIDSCREWGLTELAALHYSADYIFVYKQYDLHMDHATVPVTLATQMMEAYPTLADAKTAFGFRHVHQLDFATSGVLCIALNKKAAGVAGKLFEHRTVSKRYPALVEPLPLTYPSTPHHHPRQVPRAGRGPPHMGSHARRARRGRGWLGWPRLPHGPRGPARLHQAAARSDRLLRGGPRHAARTLTMTLTLTLTLTLTPTPTRTRTRTPTLTLTLTLARHAARQARVQAPPLPAER